MTQERYAKLRYLVHAALVRDAHRFHTSAGDLAQILIATGRERHGRRVAMFNQRPLRARWEQIARRCGVSLRKLFLTIEVLTPKGRIAPLCHVHKTTNTPEQTQARLSQVRARIEEQGHPDFVE